MYIYTQIMTYGVHYNIIMIYTSSSVLHVLYVLDSCIMYYIHTNYNGIHDDVCTLSIYTCIYCILCTSSSVYMYYMYVYRKFYYAMDNYYQNHRRYLNSWDPAQLRGDNFDEPTDNCRPLVRYVQLYSTCMRT